MAATDLPFSCNKTIEMMNAEYAVKNWFPILFLSVVAVVGSLGNLIVCVVYLCRLNKVNNRFVLSLATVDLINCLTSVPGEITDLKQKYTFGESFYCPMMRNLEAFSSLASASLLVAISIDRFKKICKPLGPQTTLREAAIAILVCCSLSISISLPAGFINGKRTVNIGGLEGSDCSIADKYLGTSSPQIYNATFFFLFAGALVLLVAMYTLIWRRLRQQKAYRRNPANEQQDKTRVRYHPDISSDAVATSTTDACAAEDTKTKNTKSGSSKIKASPTVSSLLVSSLKTAGLGATNVPDAVNQDSSSVNNVSKTQKPKSKFVDRTTLMMFIVTVVFVCSFLPYVILTTVKSTTRSAFTDLSDGERSVYNLFLRFHFLNSTMNPFIYSFFGRQFRLQIRLILQRLCRKHRAGYLAN